MSDIGTETAIATTFSSPIELSLPPVKSERIKNISGIFNSLASDLTHNNFSNNRSKINTTENQLKAMDILFEMGVTEDELFDSIITYPPTIFSVTPDLPQNSPPIPLTPEIQIIPPTEEELKVANLTVENPFTSEDEQFQKYYFSKTIGATQNYLRAPRIKDQWGREMHTNRREPWEAGLLKVLGLLDKYYEEKHFGYNSGLEENINSRLRNNKYTRNKSGTIVIAANGLTTYKPLQENPKYNGLVGLTTNFADIVENAFDPTGTDYDKKTSIISAACMKYLESMSKDVA